jgi:two-component system, NarL family, nitrate/nitrite response regulator NarL
MKSPARLATTPATTIRVLLVDDHRSVLWGLQRLIDGERPTMEVVATATNAQAAVEVLRQESVDVVLLDLDLGGESGLEAIPLFCAVSTARILVLTGIRDPAMHDRAVLAGACGVVNKVEPADTILKAVGKAAAGELWLDRGATGRIFIELSRRNSSASQDPLRERIARLTPRELEIVRTLTTDASTTTKAVAARMGISEHTLRNHLTSIYEKLGVTSRLELWVFASKNGLAER